MAELKTKKEEEVRVAREKEESEQAELAKGDKEKFNTLVSDLSSLKTKYTFKSKKHQSLSEDVNSLIDKTINYINSKN